MSKGFQFANVMRTLREPNFRDFTIGNSLSLIGTWMQRIATGWLTWELTGSTGWLGMMAFADLFPAVLIAPFAGVAADRWDQLRAMKLAQTLGALLVGALTALYFAGLVDVWALFGFTLALGIVDAAVQPFRLAFVSSLVPPEQLSAAVAIKSVTFNAARFVGPALAGLVIASVGVGWAFAANAVSFAVFLIALYRLQLIDRPRRIATETRMTADAIEGLRYAFGMPGVRTILVLMIATCLAARPLLEMLPGWAAVAFAGDATDLAALTSAFGIGAVIGGVWLAGRPSPIGLTRIFMVCCAALGLALGLFSMTTTTFSALPVALLCGLFMITSSICAQTLVQLNVADTYRGRVLSVYALILRGAPALGAVAMGVAAEQFGLRMPLVMAAGALLLSLVPAFRDLARLESVLEARFHAAPDGRPPVDAE